MEDLVPLLIFIVIAVINLLKYLAEKGGKNAPARPPKQEAPRQEPTTIEEFFTEIAEKFQPKPHELPEWPEDVDRPDYVREMKTFEAARVSPVQPPEKKREPDLPPAMPPPAPAKPQMPVAALQTPKTVGMASTFQFHGRNAFAAGMRHQHIPVPPVLRSASGRTQFDLKSREQLKKAILANMVFGPPRAYDQSFKNTMAK